MSTKDEVERLAKIWADGHYPHSRMYETEGTNGFNGFVAGFLAGEKSERVQRLIEFVKTNTSCDIRFGTVSGTFNTPSTHSPTCKKCLVLASFNASPEEKK